MTRTERLQTGMMVLTGMLVTLVTVAFARLSFGLILPFMREDLGLSYQAAGALGTASALGYLCLVMVAGAFASRWGGRAAVFIGVALTTAGFVGLSLSSHYILLLIYMLLLGFGTAFAYTPVISLLAGAFPQRRGAIIGLTNSGIGLGLLIASAVVPYLNTDVSSGWRVTWVAFAIPSAVAVAAVLLFLPRLPVHAGPAIRIDKGAVYRNRQLIVVGLLYGVIGITYITQATFMYSFALHAGLPAPTAAKMAAMMGILSLFAGPLWGMVSDRIGRPRSLLTSVSITLVGTLIPVFWPVFAGFALHYFILGCTISGMFTSVLAVAGETVEPQQAPLATSYVTLFFAGGQFLGPAIAGTMIEHIGFRGTFGISCIVIAFGIFLTLQLHAAKP
ncbi:MAG TPA: MFS transporter [Noviherbaspirillum sp.]|jgi:MFS family permease|uniref:MFS transporter n=1 Tax=Noviherbaspirillum sp. TaxID=1926288 RepID=UPI002DDD9893|nr:MFS transporter [Noviherbaspirillum sp.]HEV2611231.1 MFS transporter [Noviherbaspirillum sp.]